MKYRFVTMILSILLSFSQGLIPHIPIDISKTIVKSTTEMLPQADAIAHIVLNTNKEIINFLLDNENIPMDYKKPIILFLIEVAQKGDSSGSQILSAYYNIVDKVL
tara:strand:- start:4867 stop:5184 length:318 start_codon:yes stop_codon:yes gene_type:complete